MTAELHCVLHGQRQQLGRLLHVAEAVQEVLERAGDRVPDAVLLVR